MPTLPWEERLGITPKHLRITLNVQKLRKVITEREAEVEAKTRRRVIEEAIGVMPAEMPYIEVEENYPFTRKRGWDTYRTAALASLEQMKEKL